MFKWRYPLWYSKELWRRVAFGLRWPVPAYDSFISGECLGWNAKKLTLLNCTVESLQSMCYIENLLMKNCKLLNTTLAFEYSTVDVDVRRRIDSIMNLAGALSAQTRLES